ncbi:MAG: hypothetical protein ACOCXQ_02670 [Patescibacteria group bacterium]
MSHRGKSIMLTLGAFFTVGSRRTTAIVRGMILVAFIAYLAVTLPYGWEQCQNQKIASHDTSQQEPTCGLFFGTAGRAHDELWHVSMAEVAFDSLPFQLPMLAGEPLGGYHYLYPFLLYLLSLVGIPPLFALSVLLPVIWFIAFVSLSLMIARRFMPENPAYQASFLFFQLYGGSFAVFLRLWHYQDPFAHIIDAGHNANNVLTNMPIAFSLLPVLGIMVLLLRPQWKLRDAVIVALLLAATFGLKFYAAVLMAVAVGVYLVGTIFLRRITWRQGLLFLLLTAGSSVLAIQVFYNPLGGTATEPVFSWDPFATVRPFIEREDHFYLPTLALARYTLLEVGWGPRLLAIELLTTALYVLFRFGSRMIGLWFLTVRAIRRQLSLFEISLLVAACCGVLIPLLFVQRGEWWNVTQFLVYVAFFLNVFAAGTLAMLLRRRTVWAYALVVVILLATVHNIIDTTYTYAAGTRAAYVPSAELTALRELRTLPPGTVFVLPPVPNEEVGNHEATDADATEEADTGNTGASVPSSEVLPQKESPELVPEVLDTNYVAAFSGKPLYLASQYQLDVIGIKYEERLQTIEEIPELNPVQIVARLDAQYVYLRKGHPQYEVYREAFLRGNEKDAIPTDDNEETTVSSTDNEDRERIARGYQVVFENEAALILTRSSFTQ